MVAIAYSNPSFLEAQSSTQIEHCSFCTTQVLDKQKIYEDDHVIILYDYKPVIEGHCLVIPKRHVERLEDIEPHEMAAMHQAIKSLYQSAQKVYHSTGYLIFQKNGKEAGQSVPHVHFHFLPRKEGDYTDLGIYARMFFLQFKSPLSQEEIDLQRHALSKHFVEPISSKVVHEIKFEN